MLRSSFFGSCLAVLAVSIPAAAQVQFRTMPDGTFGTRLFATGSSVIPVSLGFGYTLPGGTVVTELDVHATGRILPVGADGSDPSESVGDLLNDSPMVVLRWDNNNFVTSESDIYFMTDGAGVATLTWAEVQFGMGEPATAQVQLFADGRVVFAYDSRVAMDDGLVGISSGGGLDDPGPVDLSSAVQTPIVTTEEVVYQDFGFTFGVGELDLQSVALEFVPTGVGGVGGWTVNGYSDIQDVHPFARVRSNGGGCFPSFTTTFTPNGSGGYDVLSGPSQFDPNIGALVGAIADDVITARGVDLGFSFPFPGGTQSQLVQIDPNGRIIPDAAMAFGNFVPSPANLSVDGFPMICSWTDFNVEASGGDGIYFRSAPGVATFTWQDVPQAGGDFLPLTQQITLLASGVVAITIEDFRYFNGAALGMHDLLIGLGDGASALVGETDVQTLSTLAANVPVYEYWQAGSGVEPLDFLIEQPVLEAHSEPRLGSSWDLQIDRVPPSATVAFMLIGFMPLDIPLDTFGIPCSLNVLEAVSAIPLGLAAGASETMPVSLSISMNAGLIGRSIYVQGVTDGASFSPLPFFFTNSNRGNIGI